MRITSGIYEVYCCVSCIFVGLKPCLVWCVNFLFLLWVMLSLVSLIGAGDRCRECFELCLILRFLLANHQDTTMFA